LLAALPGAILTDMDSHEPAATKMSPADRLESLRSSPSSRDTEERLLLKCLKAALPGTTTSATDQREAHVFLFAGQAIASIWPKEGQQLRSAGFAWLTEHPGERITMSEFLGRNWVIGMPRFRDMLSKRIELQKQPRSA
jgi:hypothetical protein